MVCFTMSILSYVYFQNCIMVHAGFLGLITFRVVLNLVEDNIFKLSAISFLNVCLKIMLFDFQDVLYIIFILFIMAHIVH